MTICEPKWNPVCRKTVTSKIPAAVKAIQEQIKAELTTVKSVSVTVDIWSDRMMRGFLGITGHYFQEGKIKSCLLSCARYAGIHTLFFPKYDGGSNNGTCTCILIK